MDVVSFPGWFKVPRRLGRGSLTRGPFKPQQWLAFYLEFDSVSVSVSSFPVTVSAKLGVPAFG